MHDDWSEAFAALPQEAPPARGWERLAARMDVDTRQIAHKTRSHGRAPAWIGFAVAATLVLTATLWERREPRRPAESSHARLASQPAKPERKPAHVPAGAAEAAITKPAITKPVSRRKPEVRVAASAAPAKVEPLYNLYAESAQLEALLALARDDRVSSAGAALLADELDAQVAAIDASLSQPGLEDGERLRLWQARVDALRQAAGFESTQRLLASQGRSDVMLVSVD
jgi:hypothetical protein